MRVVLDTNILVSALIAPAGNPAAIYKDWEQGKFTLLTCAEHLDELRATLQKPRVAELIKPYKAGRLVNHIRRLAEDIGQLPQVKTSRLFNELYLSNRVRRYRGAPPVKTGIRCKAKLLVLDLAPTVQKSFFYRIIGAISRKLYFHSAFLQTFSNFFANVVSKPAFVSIADMFDNFGQLQIVVISNAICMKRDLPNKHCMRS